MENMFDEVYTEDYLNDLIEATYEVAFAVYRKYYWNPRWGITLDDYKQEAALEVLRLFESRFITPPQEGYTKTNLKTYIYSILDKFFSINLINQANRDKNNLNYSVESYIEQVFNWNMKDGGADKRDFFSSYKDVNTKMPDEIQEISQGKRMLLEVIEKQFNMKPYRSTKYVYEVDGEPLNEIILATLIVEGYSAQEVIEKLGYNPEEVSSPTNHIRKLYKNTFDKLGEVIKTLRDSEIKLIIKYLESK